MHKPEPVLRAVAAGSPRALGKVHGTTVWVMCPQRLQSVSLSVHMSAVVGWRCGLWNWRLTCLLVEVVEGGPEEEEEVGELSVFLEDPKRK